MTSPVRVPADVDRPDKLVLGLTARQLCLLAGTATLLYLTWTATSTVIPLPIFLVGAAPVAGLAALLALGQRDGTSLDRLMLAALRQRLHPRHHVAAPEGIQPVPDWLTHHDGSHTEVAPTPLRLPAEGVTDTGTIDLGTDGLAMIAIASTVNFGLRTPSEQDSLVATFGRYLHSLTNPVQILIRTERLDLSGQIADLRAAAPSLPHPALEQAAREHADYLTHLASHTDLLRRQVLLILREPTTTTTPRPRWFSIRHQHDHEDTAINRQLRAAETRLARRLAETVDLLAPAGIVITSLDAGQATAILAAACNPDSLVPPSTAVAGADDIITTTSADTPWEVSPR